MIDTRATMAVVAATLAPGIAAMAHFFGTGVLVNVGLAVSAAIAVEASVLRMRRQSVVAGLGDGSAVVTALLIAIAMPPAVDGWLVGLAVLAALVLGKHVYGGLGANPFNPAMVGYALVLVSFPADLATWPGSEGVDQLTGATALETLKHRGGETIADVWTAAHGFGAWGAHGFEWINVWFAVGGLVLLGLRLVDWRIPIAMLATLTVLSALGYDGGSSASLGSPAFHLLSGATMLCAFYIATDPVTSPTQPRGRILFGVLVGALLFVVRCFANYPDGVAFAVLLGNSMVPLLDRPLAQSASAR